tara:strand:- start:1739 stop:2134 length:396 start_codon:yes stop_codon:yes gene_type:complete
MHKYHHIEDILKQALEDQKSITTILPKGLAVIGRGIKIQKFADKTEILNMGKGGMYYLECDDAEYGFFAEHGWIQGSKHIALSNCLHKLTLVEDRIKEEMNTRKNDKHIQNMKNRREGLLKKYFLIKQELN